MSFASSHQGREPFERIDLHGHGQTLWPDHCVQGTDGAALHPGLPLDRLAAIPRKGMDPQAKDALENLAGYADSDSIRQNLPRPGSSVEVRVMEGNGYSGLHCYKAQLSTDVT